MHSTSPWSILYFNRCSVILGIGSRSTAPGIGNATKAENVWKENTAVQEQLN